MDIKEMYSLVEEIVAQQESSSDSTTPSAEEPDVEETSENYVK